MKKKIDDGIFHAGIGLRRKMYEIAEDWAKGYAEEMAEGPEGVMICAHDLLSVYEQRVRSDRRVIDLQLLNISELEDEAAKAVTGMSRQREEYVSALRDANEPRVSVQRELALSDALKERDDRIVLLNGVVNEKMAFIDSVNEIVIALRADIAMATDTNNMLERSRDSLRRAIAGRDLTIHDMNEEVVGLKVRLDNDAGKLSRCGRQIRELQEAAVVSNVAVSDKNEGLDKLWKHNSSLRAHDAHLEERLCGILDELSTAVMQVDDLQQRNDNQKSMIESSSSQIDNLVGELKAAKASVNGVLHGALDKLFELYLELDGESLIIKSSPADEAKVWQEVLFAIHRSGQKTTEYFWDCECDESYIHSRHIVLCNICNTERDNGPDSRLDEVICMLLRELD